MTGHVRRNTHCGRNREDIRKWKRMKRPEKMAAVQRAALRLKSLQRGR
ncbi:MAG TPA: DUF1289 domain-containing protein [Pseudomonadales bacterium]|nr:DUF1289 domain-containing protein [Pseudomonadales bacterium]